MSEKCTNQIQNARTDVNQNVNEMHNQMQFVRAKLEALQVNILRNMKKDSDALIEEVLHEMQRRELKNEFHDFNNTQITRSNQHQQRHTERTNAEHDDDRQQQQQQQQHLPQYRQNKYIWNNRISQDSIPSQSATSNIDASKTATATETAKTTTTTSTATATAAAKANAKAKETKSKHAKGGSNSTRALPDKVFAVRESFLTALLQVDHMRTIYHIFHVILLILLLNSMCYDYFVEGSIKFGLGTFKSGFRGIHNVFGVWLLQHVFVFCLYYAFNWWATVRQRLLKQETVCRFWSHCSLILYVCSQLVFAWATTVVCLRLDLPYVSASVLLLESTRLLMKMHAYVRTNAAYVLAGKQKLDDVATAKSSPSSSVVVRLPLFSNYLYFLFAPTLLYRSSYPRTSRIRWQFALARFLEVVGVAFLFSYLHERHIYVHFNQIGLEPISASKLIVKLFGMMMPSALIFLAGFYLILHAWLNFTSELLRFGDRMFYKDWWASITYDAFYRNWNVVVHDWLYEYIYKDIYTYVFKGSKALASLTVFMISAVVHEYIIGLALQMFFPVMFFFFGVVGVAMVFITRRMPKTLGNVFLWFSLITGNGMLISLYAMEYYAQQNCPRTYDVWMDYFTPAFLTTCN